MGKRCKWILLMGILAGSMNGMASTVIADKDSDKKEVVKAVKTPLSIRLGGRVDYMRERQAGETIGENTGFKGNNVIITLQGNMTDRLFYRYRQRIHEVKHHNNFFDGTDFMYLRYSLNNQWDVTAGKTSIEYGSTEYMRDPSNQYILSELWYKLACYKFAVNLGYNVTKNDRLVAQAAESSFKMKGKDLYSYSLSWYGNHKALATMYSVNVLEYRPGKFLYNVGLGNCLTMGMVKVNFDYMNRATSKKNFFKDCTIRGEVMVQPNKHWNFIALAAYNKNLTHDFGEQHMALGTDITHLGAVVEFAPIPDIEKLLKIHAVYNYYWGRDGVNMEGPQLNRHQVYVGVQWEVDVLDLARRTFVRK